MSYEEIVLMYIKEAEGMGKLANGGGCPRPYEKAELVDEPGSRLRNETRLPGD
jgi:hypothetical protein